MARAARFAILLFALFASAPAHAWTDAAVRSVHARVELERDASAYVTLTATVRVHGGWLEGVELAGLDPDLVLDETAPPYALDEEGQRYEPRAEVLSGGRVQLAFGRRGAPRRGTVTVTIAYRTSLAHRATEPVDGEDRVRVRWTLPGWRSGLDGVQIEVLAPRGTRMGPRDESDTGASLETEVDDVPEGTLLRWRRAHLPRTLAWVVAADVPSDALDPSLRAAASAPVPVAPVSTATPRVPLDLSSFWLGLAALVALLACAKMIVVARQARRSRARARPLLLASSYVRAPIALALCACAPPCAGEPLLALGLLAAAAMSAAYRTAVHEEASALGAWRAADAAWIRAASRARWARWIGPSSLLDATTPLGAAHLALWMIAPWLSPLPFEIAVCVCVLPLPILATGTRLAFPTGPTDALARLLGHARRMRALPEGVGLRPVLHVSARGEVQDARLRTILDRRPRGLLRLDLVIVEAQHAGGYERDVRLLILTREGSAAERAAAERLSDLRASTSPGGRRVARVAQLGELARIVAALADCPEAPVASRGTSVPNEPIAARPVPRAVGF